MMIKAASGSISVPTTSPASVIINSTISGLELIENSASAICLLICWSATIHAKKLDAPRITSTVAAPQAAFSSD